MSSDEFPHLASTSSSNWLLRFVQDGYVTGEFPFSKEKRVTQVKALPVLPSRYRLLRQQQVYSIVAQALSWDEGMVFLEYGNRELLVRVVAVSEEAINKFTLDIDSAIETHEPESPTAAPVWFWAMGPHGPSRTSRDLEVPEFSDIEQGYSAPVRAALRELAGQDGTGISGKLLLLHGPPGTGKTTVLRALAHEWRDWCSVEVVTDPDMMFSQAIYLNSVLLEKGPAPWRLFVLEDCDELIRGDGKGLGGQALSRLLNTADGLLGQGQNIMIALTTNEPIGSLHPAVVRPGRCLAQIEVGKLSATEVSELLGETVNEEMTLAEVYAKKNQSGPTTHEAAEPKETGMYL